MFLSNKRHSSSIELTYSTPSVPRQLSLLQHGLFISLIPGQGTSGSIIQIAFIPKQKSQISSRASSRQDQTTKSQGHRDLFSQSRQHKSYSHIIYHKHIHTLHTLPHKGFIHNTHVSHLF